MWVSTLNGLARYKGKQPIPFHAFGYEDGINSTEFSFNVSTKTTDGTLFFGNSSGVRKYRLKKAALLLKTGNYMVIESATKLGFPCPKYFSKCFQKEFGITPSEYIEKEFSN